MRVAAASRWRNESPPGTVEVVLEPVALLLETRGWQIAVMGRWHEADSACCAWMTCESGKAEKVGLDGGRRARCTVNTVRPMTGVQVTKGAKRQ